MAQDLMQFRYNFWVVLTTGTLCTDRLEIHTCCFIILYIAKRRHWFAVASLGITGAYFCEFGSDTAVTATSVKYVSML
jgi:hypothetical protein